MKLCKDCRYCMPHPTAAGKINELAICVHPEALARRERRSNFAVTGEGDEFEVRFCSTERIGARGCGQEASLFKAQTAAILA